MKNGIFHSVRINICCILMIAIIVAHGVNPALADEPISITATTRGNDGHPEVLSARIDPTKTAVVIVDMWDKHWCKTFTSRVESRVERMNQTLDACRSLGMTVVFAPSSVSSFYEDTPQRRSVLNLPDATRKEVKNLTNDAPYCKTSRCECGPKPSCQSRVAWSRQIPSLRIEADDLIIEGNRKQELLNVSDAKGIDTLIYMGCATNMCMIHRKVGMAYMKPSGFRLFFVDDLSFAISGNGFDPDRGVKDDSMTPGRGSAESQRWVEQHMAASFDSRQLLCLADPSLRDAKPRIVFIIAEREYQTEESLRRFAMNHLEDRYECVFLTAVGDEGKDRNDIPGLDALFDADLLVISMRRRFLHAAQMDKIEWYIRSSGRPLMVIRPGIVPFALGSEQNKRPFEGAVVWQNFDEEVLGCKYGTYSASARAKGSNVWAVDAAADHLILEKIADMKFHTPAWIYRVAPLVDSTTVLLMGRGGDDPAVQPVAWTNRYQQSRVFYTSLGDPADFKNDAFIRLLQNAVAWSLEKDAASERPSAVDPASGARVGAKQ